MCCQPHAMYAVAHLMHRAGHERRVTPCTVTMVTGVNVIQCTLVVKVSTFVVKVSTLVVKVSTLVVKVSTKA